MNLTRRCLAFVLVFVGCTVLYILTGDDRRKQQMRLAMLETKKYLGKLKGSSVLPSGNHRLKSVAPLTSYSVSDMMNDNLEEIEKVNQLQMSYLDGIDVKKGSKFVETEDIMTKSDLDANVLFHQVEDRSPTVPEDTSRRTNIRTNYKFRRPRPKDIEKLKTKLQIELEISTDPLNASAKCVASKTFLTVLATSSPSNFDQRKFIRETWASSYADVVPNLKHIKPLKPEKAEALIPLGNMFRTFFVVGRSRDESTRKAVNEEALKHQDMVLGDFIDDNRNLTLKTRLALKWMFFDCNAKYILKTDDDVLVNSVQIIEWLKDQPRDNLYTGFCKSNSPVVRNPNSRWYVPHVMYPAQTYPWYCLGSGYLMSHDVLGKVMAHSYGRVLFPLEDLYVGLLIDEMQQVNVVDNKEHFKLLFDGVRNDWELNRLFVVHSVKGKALRQLWRKAVNATALCV